MKTKTELTQAISNLTRLNASGCYTTRIKAYKEQLDNYPKTNCIVSDVFHSDNEKEAIMLFNLHPDYYITE